MEENKKRTRQDPEYELIDTGVFAENRYFDVFVEYAKATAEDIAIRITAWNRGPQTARVCTFCRRCGFAIAGTGAIPTICLAPSAIDGPARTRAYSS